jgi:radical SAM protein with 4Fe4S-binding SPASM domain
MGQNTYASTISKEELEQLETLQFGGEIIVVNSCDEVYHSAIEYLSNQKVLGFDTETKPCFKAKAPRHNVAILQLSGGDKAFIFRLTSLGIPSELASILSSPDILKIGAAVKEDIKGLNHYARFEGNGFVDLQSPAGLINSVIVYNYDGYVYASDESRMLAEFNDYTFRLGHVNDSFQSIVYGEKARKIAQIWSNETLAGCSDCAYKVFCGADPVRNYSTQGDMYGHRPTSLLCRKNKSIIEFILSLIVEQGDEVYLC